MSRHLYQEQLRDHYQCPRNKGVIEHPNVFSHEENPSCGDHIRITGIVHDGNIADLKFTGTGCVISLAVASLLTEHCIGKSVEHVRSLTRKDLEQLIGVSLGPTRLKCALLSLQALHAALVACDEKKKDRCG